MATKNLEVNLTPQNQEWIKLIPNATLNQDIVFNKLIEMAINEGLLLEVISNSLTVGDLSKFKNAYSKMQTKRAEFLDDLEVSTSQVERKSNKQVKIEDIEEEPKREVIKKTKQKKEVKTSINGWAEDSF